MSFGIYGSAAFRRWGHRYVRGRQKYRNTLWKYKKYSQTPDIPTFGLFRATLGSQRLIITHRTSQWSCIMPMEHFPSWVPVRRRQKYRNTLWKYRKYSLQCNFCGVYLGWPNSDFAFRGEFRNLRIGGVPPVRSEIRQGTSEIQKYTVEIQEIQSDPWYTHFRPISGHFRVPEADYHSPNLPMVIYHAIGVRHIRWNISRSPS